MSQNTTESVLLEGYANDVADILSMDDLETLILEEYYGEDN